MTSRPASGARLQIGSHSRADTQPVFQTYSSAAAPIEAPISEITALDVVCAVVAVLVATASGVGFAVSIFYFLFI